MSITKPSATPSPASNPVDLPKSTLPKLTTPYLWAVAMPLVWVPIWFADKAHEWDAILLWIGAMVCVLPLFFLEQALSKRANAIPLTGIAHLTREADAKRGYRAVAWGFVALWVVLSAYLLKSASVILGAFLPLPWFMLGTLLSGVALILAFIGVRVLFVAIALLLAGLFANMYAGGVGVPSVTPVYLSEWTSAFVLALGMGAGAGVFWANAYTGANIGTALPQISARTSPRPVVLWGVALAVGIIVMLLSDAKWWSVWQALGQVGVAAALLALGAQNLRARLGWFGLLALLPIFAFALLPIHGLWVISVVLLLACVSMICIFAGYQMKISHLRKALSLPEARYNLWRAMVRIGVPLALIVAIIGFFS